jgi:FkbM family methyltransferase
MRFRVPDTLKFRWQQANELWREWRWACVAGRPRRFVTRLQPGVRIRLYGDSELCRLIYCRYFEESERAFLNRFLRPRDIFVDVGANIGLFTLIAASRIGQHGSVIAFEPTAVTHARLIDNVRLNQLTNVKCVKSALSDQDSQLDLARSNDGFDAWNSFAEPTAGAAISYEKVEAVRWDRYASDNDLSGKVTMMKIDVEGWESKVMAGGKESFSRADAPVLQVEFTDSAAKAAGSSCRILYKFLESLGYQMFIYDMDQNRLLPESLREQYPYVNLIAAKDPSFVNDRLCGK